MARYIDADRLKRTFASGIRVYDGMCNLDDVMHNIENEPTADVEEVVRCKDCKRFMEYSDDGNVEGADGDCFIRMSHSLDRQFCAVKCTDFCSYGERKEDTNVPTK